MKFYRIIRAILRLATHLFFVEIKSEGKEKVPATGPVILAANHPSSLLDSVLMSTQLPRPIAYLASSNLFKNAWIARLYAKMGTIPIYTGRNAGHNQDTFELVYQLLEQHKCLGIFPEGQNSSGIKLAKIRTGTARMALEAEDRNGFTLGLQIVPVGINFENRELFTSAVLLRFGQPIVVQQYQGLYRQDPKACIRTLTDDIEFALRQQVMHIEDIRLSQLVNDLGQLYHEQVASKALMLNPSKVERTWLGVSHWLRNYFRPKARKPLNLSSSQKGRQQISQLLNHAYSEQPQLIDELRNRTERYKDHLAQNHIRADLSQDIDRPILGRLMRLRMTLYALLIAPVALFGLINNLLPYLLTKHLARRIDNEATRAFAYFGFGFFVFLGFYLALGLGLWQLSSHNLAQSLIYITLLPPTGFICLSYRTRITQYRSSILLRTFIASEQQLLRQLSRERRGIIRRLEELHHRFGR